MENNVIIFGAGNLGIQLMRMLEQRVIPGWEETKVVEFCDSCRNLPKYIEGIKVIHPEHLGECVDGDKIIISSPNFAEEMIPIIRQYKNKYMRVFLSTYNLYEYRWGENLPLIVELDLEKPFLHYMQCMIVRHCNLRCNGCVVGANISSEYYMEVEEFERNLIDLKRLFAGIGHFKLFGGEPLLHPQIHDLCVIARKYLPEAEITIHSNGILVPSISDELIDIMKKQSIKFIFTMYQPTAKVLRKIENKLRQEGVPYFFENRGLIYEFHRMFNPKGDYDKNEIFKMCDRCYTLIDGNYFQPCYPCYTIPMIENKFGDKICDIEIPKGVNLHDENINGWDIIEMIKQPIELCKYCTAMKKTDLCDDEFFEWKNNNPQIEDWVVGGKK